MNDPETQKRLKLLNKMNKLFERLDVAPLDAIPSMILGIVESSVNLRLSKEDFAIVLKSAGEIFCTRQKEKGYPFDNYAFEVRVVKKDNSLLGFKSS